MQPPTDQNESDVDQDVRERELRLAEKLEELGKTLSDNEEKEWVKRRKQHAIEKANPEEGEHSRRRNARRN